jgi:hypothetical protein
MKSVERPLHLDQAEADWQKRAIATWEQAQRRELEEEALRTREERDRRARFLTANLEFLGVPVDPATIWYEGSMAYVSIDGVQFSAIRARDGADGYDLVIVRDCPDCHGPAVGEPIHSVSDLGRELTDWRPNSSHRRDCTGEGLPDPDIGLPRCTERERAFLDTLAELIEEAMG